jgi:hypothetical protein
VSRRWTWLAVTALTVSGCLPLAEVADSGIVLEPRGWKAQPEHRWSRDFEGFSLRTWSLQALSVEREVSQDFQVVGSAEPVVFEKATLETDNGDSYAGRIGTLFGHPSLLFDLRGATVGKALGSHLEMTLALRVGGEPREVRIEWVAPSESH